MRYLADRDNRLKVKVPKSATSVRESPDGFVAVGKRHQWRLRTRTRGMDSSGYVYVEAEWKREPCPSPSQEPKP